MCYKRFIQEVMLPRSSAQASETGDDTKSSLIPSKDDLVMQAINKAFLIASATFAYWSCQTKYPVVTLVFMCIVLVFLSFHDPINQFGLLDEIDKFKEAIQIKSSEKPQVKAVEKAQDTKEPEPRKDQVKDQAAQLIV